MTRCAAAALTLLLLVEKGHSERVEAVLLLHDDDIHTFGSVSSALEALGLSPPQVRFRSRRRTRRATHALGNSSGLKGGGQAGRENEPTASLSPPLTFAPFL
eukprot:scaffold310437_cov24-Tisochrysis_lutea.AAC.1